MLCRKSHIPVAMQIVESGSRIKSATLHFGCGECRVARFSGIHFATIETLAQESGLQTHAHRSSEEFGLVGILQVESLMGEESYLVVHHRSTHAVIILQRIERQVGCQIHGSRIMFESGHIQCVSSRYVEFCLLTHCRRIVGWFHVEIMTEGRIILCSGNEHSCQQKN